MPDQNHDAFFGGEDDYGPPRDRWKRPLLIPTAEYPGLTPEQRVLATQGAFRAPYTRASSMANYIADFEALHKWQRRRLAKGLGSREDLCAMAASLPLFHNDREKDRLTNARLDEIIDLAMEIGQVHEQANWGTAIHQFTEPDKQTGPVPARMVDDVQAFYDECARLGIKILDTEIFTAHDRHKSAGTVDHLLWVPGYGKILGDKKTGDLKPLEFGVQIAEYRDGDIYDWETDTRTQWDDDVNADFALVLDIQPGSGKLAIHELDLNYGRRMADLAAEVRDGHQASRLNVRKNVNDEILEHLMVGKTETVEMIESATTRDEMLAIREMRWEFWGDDFDAVCKARLESLAS
jgi:hypothetical protein